MKAQLSDQNLNTPYENLTIPLRCAPDPPPFSTRGRFKA